MYCHCTNAEIRFTHFRRFIDSCRKLLYRQKKEHREVLLIAFQIMSPGNRSSTYRSS